MSEPWPIPAWYYQHFDADFDLDVPEEAFGGWKKKALDFAPGHTAVVVMHAWDTGSFEEHPGWYRTVPYIPRANEIARTIFPGLLEAVRASGLPLFHVVGGGEYFKSYSGYQRARDLAGPEPPPLEKVVADPAHEALRRFRHDNVHPGADNAPDIERGCKKIDFLPQARPQGEEGIAENGRQLFALCKESGVNHLVYAGFAINWCLLLSPGGMAEMQRYGLLCSALRQATTAVESKGSARDEVCKELALWRVALSYGFVFDVEDLITALHAHAATTGQA